MTFRAAVVAVRGEFVVEPHDDGNGHHGGEEGEPKGEVEGG